jgi:hypothetical protein
LIGNRCNNDASNNGRTEEVFSAWFMPRSFNSVHFCSVCDTRVEMG